MTRQPTIITCAVTGNITTRAHHPDLPVTPEQIVEAALGAGRAGAAIIHLHARDPKTSRGSMELDHYRAAFDAIRRANPDLILNVTTGEGGRFAPSDHDPRIAAENSTLTTPERRVAHIAALRPEMCTLDLNTMWSGQAAVINPPRNVEIMAKQIEAAGVRPEIELFDSGDLQLAKYLLHKNVLKPPLIMSLVLGVRFGAPADPATMQYLSSQLPPDTQWTGFGIGRAAFPMLAQSFLLGGHVRIGMEDTVEIEDGKPCRDNAELVAKAATIVKMLGGTIASPAQAREILGLQA
jgi:uncharacterized protein (DUF849 family)